MRLLLLSLLLLLTFKVSAQESLCPANVPPRLEVGAEGRRLYDDVNNVRSEPSFNGGRIGLLPAGQVFTVVDGPKCADGYVWWQIIYEIPGGRMTGWTAEADPATGDYWLEPRGQTTSLISDDGLEQVYIELEDGSLEREGCLQPPDDYTRVWLGAAQFNARMLAMLDHAELLYRLRGGTRSFRQIVTQGSYTGGTLAASFGTHDDGGAVDLSVISATEGVLWDEIPLMVDSLRVAGFAAWLRSEDQLYPGSIIHIHAIAIGDNDLSEAARAQIDGEYGYLRGYNGLPPEWGGPGLDEHGGPVICQWMIAQGFTDLRAS